MKYNLALLLSLMIVIYSISGLDSKNALKNKYKKFSQFQTATAIGGTASNQPNNSTNPYIPLDVCVLTYNSALFCKFNNPNIQPTDLQNCVASTNTNLQNNFCMPCFSNFFGRVQNKMRLLGSLNTESVEQNESIQALITDAKKSVFRKLLFSTKHCAISPMNLRIAYEQFTRDYDSKDVQNRIDYFITLYDDMKDDFMFPNCPKANVLANLMYALLARQDLSTPGFYSSEDGKSYKKVRSSLKPKKNKKWNRNNLLSDDDIDKEFSNSEFADSPDSMNFQQSDRLKGLRKREEEQTDSELTTEENEEEQQPTSTSDDDDQLRKNASADEEVEEFEEKPKKNQGNKNKKKNIKKKGKKDINEEEDEFGASVDSDNE